MKNTLPQRAVLYVRVATVSQLDEFTMENQSARLHQQAERDGIEIVGEIRANEKGITIDRPGLRSAVKLAVEQRADAILATTADRIARSVGQHHRLTSELDKLGIRIYTCNGALHCMPEFEQLLIQYAAVPR